MSEKNKSFHCGLAAVKIWHAPAFENANKMAKIRAVVAHPGKALKL
jgi:hypothetical protein